MKINKQLALTIPVGQSDGSTIHVYSMPISRDVFEKYYLVIAKTFSAIYEHGLGITGAPRISAMMLKQIAQELGKWDGPEGVERGLMGEIHRLTNVLIPGATGGWETVPFAEAVSKELLDEDDVSEVNSCVVFFTVNYSMHKKEVRELILTSACSAWNAQITSLNSTEYVASLRTLTQAASSGGNSPPALEQPPSSVPF